MKKLIPLLLAIVFLLTIDRPASAEWSQDAKDEVGAQLSALYLIPTTFSFAFSDMREFPERIPEYRSMFGSLGISMGANAMLHHFRGLIWLMDGNAQGNTPDGILFLETATRDAVIQRGLDSIEDAEFGYANALAKLDVMVSSYPECSGSCRAKTIRSVIQNAVNGYRSFDPNHDWTEPRLDANLAFSALAGSTDLRHKSGIAGPHGDYRFLLQNMKGFRQYTQHAMFDLMGAAEIGSIGVRNAAVGGTSAFQFANLMRINFVVTGLAIGWEHPTVASDITIMFDQGSTSRGREFFQVAMIQQLLINVERGNEVFPINGFGLTESNGAAGSFAALRGPYRSSLFGAIGDQAVVNLVANSAEHLADGWALTDQAAWDGASEFLLKNPPFDGGGGGPPPASLTCGVGTIQLGDECVIDETACPPPVGGEPFLTIDLLSTSGALIQCVTATETTLPGTN